MNVLYILYSRFFFFFVCCYDWLFFLQGFCVAVLYCFLNGEVIWPEFNSSLYFIKSERIAHASYTTSQMFGNTWLNLFLVIIKNFNKSNCNFLFPDLIHTLSRFSLRLNESGGGGTCRDFWELIPSTSSPQWQATASTSAPKSLWWRNAARPHVALPPAKMTSPPSECRAMLRL